MRFVPNTNSWLQTKYLNMIAVTVTCFLSSGVVHAQKTDSGVYAEPALPALPASGGTFRDPVFGSVIMRVTDALTLGGGSCRNAYSYWPTFNSDNTRMYVLCDGGYALIFPFDPVAFQLRGKPFILDAPTPGGQSIFSEDAIWSTTNPDILFFHSDDTLYSYNVSLRSYTELVSFRTQMNGESIRQISVSTDNNTFAFHRVNSNYSVVGYSVWAADTKRLLHVKNTDVNEVRIDKTGRYLIVFPEDCGQHFTMSIVDVLDGTTTNIVDGSPDYAPGHLDMGRGSVMAHDRWNNQTTFRSLANPHNFVGIHPMYNQWDVSSHLSMLADDERWGLKSNYAWGETAHTPGAFRDEIFQMATDGSQQVKRWAHHRSIVVGYWDTPRANISHDSKFIAFTSNWGNSGRQDLFLIKTSGASAWPTLPKPQSILINPGMIVSGGTGTTNQVLLSGPAPQGGAVVQLLSSDPAIASVPTVVTVSAGSTTSPFFVITAGTVATNSTATITASYAGATKSSVVSVVPLVVIADLALTPTALVGGTSSTSNQVVLGTVAPAGGAIILLTSSNAAVVVPTSVAVPAGATVSAPFSITTRIVQSSTVVNISAACNGSTKAVSLTVTPATVQAAGTNQKVVWNNQNTGIVSEWLLKTDGTVTGIVDLSWSCNAASGCSRDWRIIGTGDFNSDGTSDVLWHNATTGEVVAWMVNGTGTVIAGQALSSSCSTASGCARDWRAVGTGDFNGDGHVDVLWQNVTTGGVIAWLLNGGGTVIGTQTVSWTCSTASGCAGDWKIVGTGDFNGDGKVDVLWHNATTGDLAAWLLNGTGTVLAEQKLSLICNAASGCSRDWAAIGTGDFNGDGKVDVLWHNATTGDLAAWLLNSTGTMLAEQKLSLTCNAASGCSQAWKAVGIMQ
jgi:hypothetical protein